METQSNTTNTNPLHKILIIALLVLSMLAGATGTATADPGSDEDGPIILDGQLEQEQEEDPGPQIGGETPSELRRYTVYYSSFYAVDETGYDWTGSDEMTFHLLVEFLGQEDQQERATHGTKKYGDVDTGETHHFTGDDRCIIPGGCFADSPGIRGQFVVGAAAIQDASWLVGEIFPIQRASLRPADLEVALPYVGRGTTVDLTLTSSSGEYRVRISIRRVADAEPESVPSEWDNAPVLTAGDNIVEVTEVPNQVDLAPTMTTADEAAETRPVPAAQLGDSSAVQRAVLVDGWAAVEAVAASTSFITIPIDPSCVLHPEKCISKPGK